MLHPVVISVKGIIEVFWHKDALLSPISKIVMLYTFALIKCVFSPTPIFGIKMPCLEKEENQAGQKEV